MLSVSGLLLIPRRLQRVSRLHAALNYCRPLDTVCGRGFPGPSRNGLARDGHALIIFRYVDEDFPRWLVVGIPGIKPWLLGPGPVAPDFFGVFIHHFEFSISLASCSHSAAILR